MGHRVRSRRRAATSARILALGMALCSLVSLRPVRAAPGDIFTVSAPAVTDTPARAASISPESAAVATKTGALTYSYPIKVPPGRVQPTLSLDYSSQAPIYGTLANGFSIGGLPIITEETSAGRMAASALSVQIKTYTSSMAGGRPLVAVDEVGEGTSRYRAQGDSTWTRYERHASGDFWWRAYTPDGMTYIFGDKDGHTSSCTIVSDGYAPLTRMIDPFGSRVDFMYQAGVDGECRIKAITWGQNDAAAVGYFAAVEFDYATTSPSCTSATGAVTYVGAQTSYRTGTKIVTGASQLMAIRAAAFAADRRWQRDAHADSCEPLAHADDHAGLLLAAC